MDYEDSIVLGFSDTKNPLSKEKLENLFIQFENATKKMREKKTDSDFSEFDNRSIDYRCELLEIDYSLDRKDRERITNPASVLVIHGGIDILLEEFSIISFDFFNEITKYLNIEDARDSSDILFHLIEEIDNITGMQLTVSSEERDHTSEYEWKDETNCIKCVLGRDVTLCTHWFDKDKEIGERMCIELENGDLYLMSKGMLKEGNFGVKTCIIDR